MRREKTVFPCAAKACLQTERHISHSLLTSIARPQTASSFAQ
jgi:hypothetical protein